MTRLVYYDEFGAGDGEYRYEYDDKGNRTREVSCDEFGAVDSESRHEYDDKGNQTCWVYYGNSGAVEYEYRYEYDDKGNEIRQVSYDKFGAVEYEARYEYDDKGNETREVSYDEFGAVQYEYRYQNTYGDEGKLIKIIEWYNGEKDHKVTYEYDDKGNVTKETLFFYESANELITEYTYAAFTVSVEKAEKLKEEHDYLK
jgi:hypothetical protein